MSMASQANDHDDIGIDDYVDAGEITKIGEALEDSRVLLDGNGLEFALEELHTAARAIKSPDGRALERFSDAAMAAVDKLQEDHDDAGPYGSGDCYDFDEDELADKVDGAARDIIGDPKRMPCHLEDLRRDLGDSDLETALDRFVAAVMAAVERCDRDALDRPLERPRPGRAAGPGTRRQSL
jgi:hypothetical protein